ncbi:MAG: Crp/Fnr family transcriptional regulator [Pseudomonadota bacterium]
MLQTAFSQMGELQPTELSGEAPACRQSDCAASACRLSDCKMLRAAGQTRTVSARDTLFWQDDDAEFLFIVIKGMARACRLTSDGRRQINRFAFPGDLLAATNAGFYPYSVEAVTGLEVIALPRASADTLIDQVACLRKLVSATILKELDEVHDQVMLLGRMTAAERVGHVLALLAKHTQTVPGQPIDLAVSRADIADYSGLTVETVSRTLSRFKREGKIRMLGQREIIVPDFSELAEAA